MATIEQHDNSAADTKLRLRKTLLPPHARVLDLFCGYGYMYRSLYESCAEKYLGIDQNKIHDKNICELGDNKIWLENNDISQFNVFDIDCYAGPTIYYRLIFDKLKRDSRASSTLVFFSTDGAVFNFKMSSTLIEVYRDTEAIEKEFTIPGLYYFYKKIHCTAFIRAANEAHYTTTRILFSSNQHSSTAYWGFVVKKI